MNTLVNIALFHARPGQRAALGNALLALVTPSRAEAGNLQYDICQSNDDPDTWLVVEQWRSPGAFDYHMATPYVTSFLSRVPELCTDGADLRGYTPRSVPAARTGG